jgi:hypothetical protein
VEGIVQYHADVPTIRAVPEVSVGTAKTEPEVACRPFSGPVIYGQVIFRDVREFFAGGSLDGVPAGHDVEEPAPCLPIPPFGRQAETQGFLSGPVEIFEHDRVIRGRPPPQGLRIAPPSPVWV